MLDLITSANSRINKLISGETPTELLIEADSITSTTESGISVYSTSNNRIGLRNTASGYNLSETRAYDITSGAISELSAAVPLDLTNSLSSGILLKVKPFNNIVRIYAENKLPNNLNIYLDDNGFGWTKGQVVNITSKSIIEWEDTSTKNSIKIYTGTHDNWVLIDTIHSASLLSNKPYIELLCTDNINKTFETDIIR